MRRWLWRHALVALWVALVAMGMGLFSQVFGYWCDDCIGPRPGYFGEGGFKVDWDTVVIVAVLNATLVTVLLALGRRGFRRARSGLRG